MKGTGGKTQRLPRFLREYRGEVPGCSGGVGAYALVRRYSIKCDCASWAYSEEECACR